MRVDGMNMMKGRNSIRLFAFLVGMVAVSVIAHPHYVSAQNGLSASVTVNEKRSTILPYGSEAMLSWETSGFSECNITPGDWSGLQGTRLLHNVTTKQTYQLSCKGEAGTATAYTTFAVVPPTFEYLKSSLETAKTAGKNPASINDVMWKIDDARQYYQARQFAKSKKILDRTVSKMDNYVNQGKISSSNAAAYGAAVNSLTASWSVPSPIPDILSEDVVTPVKPLNGGYPTKWANAPMNQYVDNWGMYTRQSVSYVAWKVASTTGYMPYWGGRGNANQWDDNAKTIGLAVDTNPTAGSVAISHVGVYGHAMYVEKVGMLNGQSAVYVSQYNAHGDGMYSEGWRFVSNLVFIHF